MKPRIRPPAPFLPLGDLQVSEVAPQFLRFQGSNASLEIHVLAPDLFRLLVEAPAATPGPSWAVAKSDWAPTELAIRRRGSKVAIATLMATCTLDLKSGGVRVTDRHEIEVFALPPGAIGFADLEPHLSLRLADREALFGLGETTGAVNKRGLIREFWNLDVLAHAPAIHPGLRSLYVSIPFALSIRDGRAAGFFWDNPSRQTWDLGQTQPDLWQMKAEQGALDLYLLTGPRVADVVARFTELTGRMPMPPRWALGYHQSRYSYESRAELERIAALFRRHRVPCDALYCDIHHLDGRRVFTFGKAFPRPKEMAAKLEKRGFRLVTIVDPGVKDDPRFGVLRRGKRLNAFVKDPSGRTDFLGQVWPGRSRFPDFLNAQVRAWWGDEQKALLDLGIAGFWNDMNEPSNFARPDKTLDPRSVHRSDHGRRRHASVHNVYGSQMARASREGALRHRPDRRPFVITRAGYAGVQRHALVWTGDSSSCWEHLADVLQMLLNLGLSGVAFAGGDVGGFLDNPTPELFVRWLQMAVFTPFLRNHSNLGTLAQEPWAFGRETEAIARDFINLRYQLHPYLYGLFDQAARDGTPIMRPLLWHHANDPVAVACGDQFLLGENLLVAPVLRQGAVARSVYLPRGEWFDFWTGSRFPGGIHVTASAPLERIPLFIKAGTLLPMTSTRQFIGSVEPDTVILHLWPGDEGRLDWYDDDGLTQNYETGLWQRRRITASSGRRAGQLHIPAPEGSYRGAASTWRVIVRCVEKDHRVRVDGRLAQAEFVPELALLAFELPVRDTPVEARWFR